MRRSVFLLAVALLAGAVPAAPAAAAPGAAQRCAECGMTVDLASRFAARIGRGEGALLFCDVGDLLSHLRGHRGRAASAEVRDAGTGAWVGAGGATYVRDAERFATPMLWGVAAFADRARAAREGTALTHAEALEDLP